MAEKEWTKNPWLDSHTRNELNALHRELVGKIGRLEELLAVHYNDGRVQTTIPGGLNDCEPEHSHE